MKRGDVVLCNLSGDYGKSRSGIVVQSNIFNPTHSSIVICPLTSFLINAPLFRLEIKPSHENGLQKLSQLMVDKITTIKRDKICQIIGILSLQEQKCLDDALKLWLGLEF